METKAGRIGGVVTLLVAARDNLRAVFYRRPSDPSAREALGTACIELGEGLVAADRHAEAMAAFRECASLELEFAGGGNSQFRPNRVLLAKGLLGVARCHLSLDEVVEADRVSQEWRALWNRDPVEHFFIAKELGRCFVAAHGTPQAEALRGLGNGPYPTRNRGWKSRFPRALDQPGTRPTSPVPTFVPC